MKKVIVIGSPGAGKSTFARRLRDITGLALYHLDLIWHKEDKTTVSKEEFDRRLLEILQTDGWIIDGNYQRTLEMRLKECDTVFLLDYPTRVCLEGAASRIGKKREDLPWIESELDPEFEMYIRDFSKTKLPLLYEKLEGCNKAVYVFKSRAESDCFLDKLKEVN